MGAGGKLVLAERYEAILDDYLTYFGLLDEQKNGGHYGVRIDNPHPMLYALHQQMERWHSLPLPGGLLDQPVVLMHDLIALDSALAIRARQTQSQQPINT